MESYFFDFLTIVPSRLFYPCSGNDTLMDFCKKGFWAMISPFWSTWREYPLFYLLSRFLVSWFLFVFSLLSDFVFLVFSDVACSGNFTNGDMQKYNYVRHVWTITWHDDINRQYLPSRCLAKLLAGSPYVPCKVCIQLYLKRYDGF